jgi:hypothetical protein
VTQLFVAAAVILAAVLVSAIVNARRRSDPPTQPRVGVPLQLDRTDFAGVSPWLVVVFSSATCQSCTDVVRKAAVLRSPSVDVVEAEYTSAKHLHVKYAIDAVPIVVVADRDGVVRSSFVGPVTATDLWAAVAEARHPGSSPEPHLGQSSSGQSLNDQSSDG